MASMAAILGKMNVTRPSLGGALLAADSMVFMDTSQLTACFRGEFLLKAISLVSYVISE